jgi:CRISPR-associated protein Csb2
MHLILNVTFPFGRFHGGEFPPSPARLFQALIAGSHRGVYIQQNAEARDRALEWLENIAPPIIETCQAEMFGAGATNYVPNNDNSFAHNRTAKSMQAFVLREDSVLRYVWQFPDSEQSKANAKVVCAMARLATHLGHGRDAVFVSGEVLEDGYATAKASIRERVVFQPKEQKGGDWTVPRAGALAAYKKRYEEFLKTGNSHTVNVPLRQVKYVPDNTIDLSCPYALFEMRELLDGDRFFSFDGRDLRPPAAMVRHSIVEFFDSGKGGRFKKHYGEDLISRKVYGYEPKAEGEQNKPVNHSHLAFIPIPNLYPPHPDGRVRRVLLAGFGFESETESEMFDDIARNLNGAEIKDNGEPVARLMQVEEYTENKFFNQFYGQSSRLWRSVTPIILSGFNRRGRKPEQLLYRALSQIKIENDAIESVAIYRSPIVPKTFRPMDYHLSGYLSENPRYHAEIIFKRPVSGCLVIGRGRHAGFGLMMPMTKHEHDETT